MMKSSLIHQLRLFFTLVVLTGIIYPVLVTMYAQLFFTTQSKGSCVSINSKIIGSELIAQKFESPRYFWSRPSAIDYNPLSSGGSNLGPTSAALKLKVEERKAALLKAHPDATADNLPSELLFASGSGLDPHIRKKTAYFQLERIAKARSVTREELQKFIDSKIRYRFGLFREPYFNVLLLNQALDEKFGKPHE